MLNDSNSVEDISRIMTICTYGRQNYFNENLPLIQIVKSRPNQAERDGISTIYVQNHRRLTVPKLTAILPNFWIFPGPDIPKDYLWFLKFPISTLTSYKLATKQEERVNGTNMIYVQNLLRNTDVNSPYYLESENIGNIS